MQLGRDKHSWFQEIIDLKTLKSLVWLPKDLGDLPRSGCVDLSQDTPDLRVIAMSGTCKGMNRMEQTGKDFGKLGVIGFNG